MRVIGRGYELFRLSLDDPLHRIESARSECSYCQVGLGPG